MNLKKIALIIGGVVVVLLGIVSLMFMLVYHLTQGNHKDYLFILCFGIIGLGIYLFIKAGNSKRDAE
jgi:hypothetical protein